MTGWIERRIGDSLQSVSTHCHPSAIGLAVAFGLAIGLIPKDNLLVLVLAASMCFVRMNYLLAGMLIVAVSFMAPWTDGVIGRLGQWILERPALQEFWNEIASWPILPWLRWSNTVVLGGFIAGAISFVPTYSLCLLLTHRFQRLRTQLRVDAIVTEVKHYHVQVQADQRRRQQVNPEAPAEDRRRSIKKRGSQQHRIDKNPASEVVKPNVIEPRPEPAKHKAVLSIPSQSTSAMLQETVIEIVRYRPKGTSSVPSKEPQAIIHSSPNHSNASSSTTMNPIIQENIQSKLDQFARRSSEQVPKSEDIATERANALPMVSEPAPEKPREEALRYLLWHLSGVHRQARHQEPVS
ncbi:MAG: TIGR03546 family protein [Pirellulaceae bacterium]|nr:TIGR03546 family protein [Pirellulaceae bacterium]